MSLHRLVLSLKVVPRMVCNHCGDCHPGNRLIEQPRIKWARTYVISWRESDEDTSRLKKRPALFRQILKQASIILNAYTFFPRRFLLLLPLTLLINVLLLRFLFLLGFLRLLFHLLLFNPLENLLHFGIVQVQSLELWIGFDVHLFLLTIFKEGYRVLVAFLQGLHQLDFLLIVG